MPQVRRGSRSIDGSRPDVPAEGLVPAESRGGGGGAGGGGIIGGEFEKKDAKLSSGSSSLSLSSSSRAAAASDSATKLASPPPPPILPPSQQQQPPLPHAATSPPPPALPANSSTSAPDHGGGRRSLSYALRPSAPAYYDSRAATRAEYRRRAHTLQEYYDVNPHLLPQLPFTWHHGRKRWRLILFAFFVFVDASAVPIALYYGLKYAGSVEGWKIFAVVTSIWGGPTYLEFGVRTLRLIKKERFYRPLGTESRWCFDMLTWMSVVTITAVTALFIVGSAPHIVWLRVLCMPAPAILYCVGGIMALITLYNVAGWKAPFRISSTAKGDPVLPAVYYLVEDVAAVNAGAGRPYREALAARYKASPRFQRMLYVQSIFWSVPAVLLAAGLTVPAVSHDVPADIAYGLCWAVPFLWCALWGLITIRWCKRDMVRERLEWEADFGGTVEQEKTRGGRPDPDRDGDRDTDASASTVVEQRGRLSSHRLDEAAVV